MKATRIIFAVTGLLALAPTALRADSWSVSMGGEGGGGSFGFHYSTGHGALVAPTPVYLNPAPVYVAPVPVKPWGPRVIHISPQVVTHRSWRLGHHTRPKAWVPPPRTCAPARPVVVVAGCR